MPRAERSGRRGAVGHLTVRFECVTEFVTSTLQIKPQPNQQAGEKWLDVCKEIASCLGVPFAGQDSDAADLVDAVAACVSKNAKFKVRRYALMNT